MIAKLTSPRILIFIPTYNGSKTLPWVLDRISPQMHKRITEILVVDNCSPDNAYLTALGYATKHGLENLRVIRNETNLGYGGSQKKAYQYAVDNGYDIVVMLHGDGQYPVEQIPELIEPIEKGKADLVFGSRIIGDSIKNMPRWRYAGNRFLTMLENYWLGMNISEFHSGFRAYRVAALKKVKFQLCSSNYHFDTEILIQFCNKRLRIAEIAIPTHYGKESASPPFSTMVKYTFGILNALRRYSLHKKGIKKLPMYE
ncbi:MAG: glycosyltransferase family 2 protein [Nanoarchaeota archaeon]